MNNPSFLPLGVRIGYYEHREPFGIAQTDRRQHMWVVGASGTGKSSFIQGRIQDDSLTGRGVGIIDPHGDLAQEVMAAVPPERVNDVVLLDRTATEWRVAGRVPQRGRNPDRL